MSGTAPVRTSSVSSSGYADGLGRRLLEIDRASGEMRERLVLRPELTAFEQSLQERQARAAKLDDERFARPRAIESDEDGRLTVLSDDPGAHRLSDAIDTAAGSGIIAGIDAALGLLLELLPALGYLHGETGYTHGCLGPGRLALTPQGKVVILDWIYGAALERLGLTRQRLWADFGVAPPPTAGPARFDVAADLTQAAMTAAALVVGRPLSERDYPDGIPALRAEIGEVALIRGSAAFGEGVGKFFDRLLPTRTRRSFLSADEAVLELRQLVRREIGIDACRTALKEFLQQVEAADNERADEAARLATEQLEAARAAATERAEIARKEQERLEAERREQERLEAERREQERLERERQERERAEQERLAREKAEAEAREREQLEAERREQERLEAERRERERLERERQERERAEQERIAREKAEAEARERERLEAERREQERLEAERREQERLERERQERERAEQERIAREKAEAEARERERLEAERREQERLEAERREQERLERERQERERAEQERIAREKAEAEARERAERERIAREKAEAERRERERLEAERREQERLEAERREQERLERERQERERAEQERVAREKAEAEARERAERERIAREKAEAEARERAERERVAREKADAERRERERLEAERREQERLEAERREQERVEAERREQERLEAERREQERVAREKADAEAAERAAAEAASRPSPAAAPAKSKRRKRDRAAKERKHDKLRSSARPQAPAPARAAAPPVAPPPAAGWLVPPDRAAAFEPPVADDPQPVAPPPAPMPPRPVPVYVPPPQPTFPAAALSVPEELPPPAAAPAAPIRLKSEPRVFHEGSTRPVDKPAIAPIALKQTAPPPVNIYTDPTPVGHERERSGGPSLAARIPWSFAVAAVVILAAGVAAYRYLPGATSKAPATTSSGPATAKTGAAAPVKPTTGSIAVTTQPDGARVLLDGKAAGNSPVTLPNITPGRHVITVLAETGAVKRTVRVEAGAEATVDVPIFPGFAAISAPVLLDVSENGRGLGTTENHIMLAPGRHELRLSNKALLYSTTETVDIEPGEVRQVRIDPKGTANINAQPWAEVWIDGKKAGETPLANLPLTIGVRQILFRNPQYGERNVTATITAGEPATITVDMTKKQ